MRRLTTPEHRFVLPIDPEDIARIRIAYAQQGQVVLTKEGTDVTMNGAEAIVKLTQEDTKKFTSDRTVEIQVRILTAAGEAVASDIINVTCQRVLDDEVMV